jgi:predicted amidohydrolase YtcJ
VSTPAELAIRNGSVYTVDAAGSWTDAIAVRDGQIVALGSRDVAAVTTPATEVIDATGTLVLPGFQDAHVHAPFAGLNRLHVDLAGLDGVDDYLRAIAAFERAHPHLEWIIGGGWALEHFPRGIASKRLLDKVCPDKPVFLFSRDVHAAWVNSEALRRAGIEDQTPDPPNGRIERDPHTGEVIGTLQEAAAFDFNNIHVPLPSLDMWEQAILEAQRHLCRLGITGWQDAWVTAATAQAYRSLADQGRLTSRVVGAQWWEWDQGLEQIDQFLEQRHQNSHPTFGAGTVKIMVDGILENYTGALLEPYCSGCGGAPPDRGMMHVDAAALRAAVTALDAHGFQVHMHAIGDRAVRASLDAVEAAQLRNGASDNRHHIAHLQLVHPDDVRRFRALGVVANCQTFWAKADAQLIDMTAPQIGLGRARTMFPFGDLARSGATLAMGSDWAVTTANPLEQIEVAITRTDPADREASSYSPDQALTLPVALRAFTAGSAYVNHDHLGGSIELGKRADFAIVDRDLFDPTTGPVGDAKVIYAVASGVVVSEQ